MRYLVFIFALSACEQGRVGSLSTTGGFDLAELQCLGWCDVVISETDYALELDRDKTGSVTP